MKKIVGGIVISAIIVLVAVMIFSNTVKEMDEIAGNMVSENEFDKENYEIMNEKLDIILSNQLEFSERLAEAENQAPSPSPTSSPSPVPTVEPTTSPCPTPIPTAAPASEDFTVLLLYNNKLVDIAVGASFSTETTELQYPGYAERDLNFLLSGKVSAVYAVDENGNYLSSISFKKINEITQFYFNMSNGGGKYYFEVILTDDSHYYFGVYY